MNALFLGIIIVSFALSYAWWTRVRVINLRQDIYDLRDELFDKAMALKTLDDPAYAAARDHLNSVAISADCITVPLLAFSLYNGVESKQIVKTDNLALQEAIDRSLIQCTCRIARYLRHETFIGIIVVPIFKLSRLKEVMEEQADKWVNRWVRSVSPEELERVGSTRSLALDAKGPISWLASRCWCRV